MEEYGAVILLLAIIRLRWLGFLVKLQKDPHLTPPHSTPLVAIEIR